MSLRNPERPPDVVKDQTLGAHRYVLRAWLDQPCDWIYVAEWEIERRDELEEKWVREMAEDVAAYEKEVRNA